jgi:hypothetical protein
MKLARIMAMMGMMAGMILPAAVQADSAKPYVNPALAAQVGSGKAAKIMEFLNEGKGTPPAGVPTVVAVPVVKPVLEALPAITQPKAAPEAKLKLAALPSPAKKPEAPKKQPEAYSYNAFDPSREKKRKEPSFELSVKGRDESPFKSNNSSSRANRSQPGTVKAAKVMPVKVANLAAPAKPATHAAKSPEGEPPVLPAIPENAGKKPEPAKKEKDVAQAFDNVEPVLANAKLVPIMGDSALLPPELPVKEARSALPEVKDEPKIATRPADAEIQQLASIAPASGAPATGERVMNDAAPFQQASLSQPRIAAAGQFTRNVVDRMPVDRQSSAVLGDGKLMFFSQVQGMAGKSLLHRWKVNGKVVEERRFPVAGDEWRTWSQLWLKSDYTGTITVEMLSDGKVIGSESIEVKS